MKLRLFALCLVILGATSCAIGQDKIPARNQVEDKILIEYAFHFLDDKVPSKNDVIAQLKKKNPDFVFLDSIISFEDVKGSMVLIHAIDDALESYTPPDFDFLEHSNRGLSDKQKQKLQSSNHAMVVDLVCEKEFLIKTLAAGNQVMGDIAVKHNAVIYDSETRETFSAEVWNEHRLIKGEDLNIQKHITIHLYQDNDEYCRAITLGMAKFGLPDICMENVSCYSNKGPVNLINLTAQTLYEQKQIEEKGKLQVDIKKLKNKDLRETLLEGIVENGKKKGEIDLIVGQWEEGDPENRLIEIAFGRTNPQVEHDALISSIFGSSDEITSVKHDDELLAASQRAKDKLPELKEKFTKGLPTGSYLLMKFPFESDEGQREWMWVEIVKWQGDEIKGILQNDPYYIPNLKSGQEVTKDVNDMFDYILQHPDGSEEGNETGKIMMGKN